ncbi:MULTISPECIES: energy transducer TonB [Tenacibaculum]|uniref:energy transducer TonB n=1 Tax=Tenacibaculum TaxID=104267 RepID=UPI001F0B10E7|nr:MULTISPECIES: energy transducer TonB [Tenacibaculum]MCH3881082.1 energy transducer TonB [Tenacibaculum aquimarinum]MCH3884052.1 energy transducer TonB [Tenacibaculum aquimarinum]MDO6599318.1 energy transducer TonB [Tenacibaculum sp. 1_MG-2023]
MEIKKNPKSNLENYSKLFMQLGLVLALFVTYVAIEQKTYDKSVSSLADANMANEIEEETIIIQNTPPPPPPKTPPPPTPEKIEVVEDDKEVEETVIETTETDETEAVEVEEIVEVEEEEEVVEDVPFSIIEEVPVFPGCTGTKAQKKDCLNKKMRKHVQRNFDAELANELGLAPGKKKIYVQFKIDKDGSITAINARAPHPRLKKEAIRIAKKLPKMKPGRQRGKAVRVGYTLPITFNVE